VTTPFFSLLFPDFSPVEHGFFREVDDCRYGPSYNPTFVFLASSP